MSTQHQDLWLNGSSLVSCGLYYFFPHFLVLRAYKNTSLDREDLLERSQGLFELERLLTSLGLGIA